MSAEEKAAEQMRVVIHDAGGCDAESLRIGPAKIPKVQPDEILVKVAASAVNRADILQRRGLYPPPPGASGVLGLEISGLVDVVGADASGKWAVGDPVMALVSGGGYAEKATVHYNHAIPVPAGMPLSDAASVPEAWLTAFQLLTFVANVRFGSTVLIHAGASGVGTAAIQLVTKVYKGKAIATVGSQSKVEYVEKLGAVGINYKEENFADRVKNITDGHGVDVILDCVGATYWEKNAEALAVDGTWIVYGLMGGPKVEGDLLANILRKRITIRGTTLRTRSNEYKTELIGRFSQEIVPLFQSGELKVHVDSVYPLGKVSEAHKHVEANQNMGKVVLIVQDIRAKHVEDHSEL